MTERTRGTLMMLLSAVFFALMGALVRGLPEVSPFTTVMGRFVGGMLVCLGLFVVGLDRPRWVNWPWLVARGAIGGAAVVLFYWSIPACGLAKATMLSYTYVVFAALLAVPILHERLRPAHWLAVAVAAAGAVLICGLGGAGFRLADLVPLLAGFLSGFAVICITRCRETDTSINIFWSQSAFGAAIAAWPMATRWVPLTPFQFAMVAAIALAAAAGQLAMTYAYKHTGATQGSLLSLLTPVLTGLIGVLYFREPGTAGFIAGAGLILVSCVYFVLSPAERPQQAAPEH
jgi:drug/metabolite transporter (DMT)-like permease